MHRLSKVKLEWTSSFAYAIGLLTTDGNLSKDGRHLNMTSKDEDQIITFKKCLGLQNKIGRKTRAHSREKKYYQVQFGDTNFYEFLLTIGLKPAKSKTLGKLSIPDKFFADFFRGCIDGDGNINIARHPESRHPQLRVRLFSASPLFLDWIIERVRKLTGIQGGWIEQHETIFRLSFGKADSIKIFSFIYYDGVEYYLKRKYATVEKFGRVAELV